MIEGLKLAFTGAEIVRGIDGRIEAHRAAIRVRRDEIDGKIVRTEADEIGWQVPAEVVEDEIAQLEHNVRKLTLFRDRMLPAETYLLGTKGLEFAGLLPPRPVPAPDLDIEQPIRWVAQAKADHAVVPL